MARVYEALEVSKKKTAKRKRGNYLRYDDLPYGVKDQLERLKASTILRRSGQKIKSILFVSYRHKEGTTTLVANFAELLAQNRERKVLIVDGNTRNPCLHNYFNIDNAAGFSDVFNQDKNTEIIMNTNIPNLFVIPGGAQTYDPSQSFDHDQFENFMEDLKRQYNFIIFDCSPLAKYHDAIILASHVDAVILVIQAEKTPWYEVKRAKGMIEDKNMRVLGAVLNKRKFYIPKFIFERFF